MAISTSPAIAPPSAPRSPRTGAPPGPAPPSWPRSVRKPAAARALKSNRQEISDVVDALVPGLIDIGGVGPVTAAQVIVSYSHVGRVRSEAAFAAMAGTSPLEASSGPTTRHRLNRGGDRALNRAIHTITLTRMRSCPRTRDYVNRRTSEGETSREIRACSSAT